MADLSDCELIDGFVLGADRAGSYIHEQPSYVGFALVVLLPDLQSP